MGIGYAVVWRPTLMVMSRILVVSTTSLGMIGVIVLIVVGLYVMAPETMVGSGCLMGLCLTVHRPDHPLLLPLVRVVVGVAAVDAGEVPLRLLLRLLLGAATEVVAVGAGVPPLPAEEKGVVMSVEDSLLVGILLVGRPSIVAVLVPLI